MREPQVNESFDFVIYFSSGCLVSNMPFSSLPVEVLLIILCADVKISDCKLLINFIDLVSLVNLRLRVCVCTL